MRGNASRLLAAVPGLLLVVHLILIAFFPIVSEDTWWHLKQGELYVSSRSLPAQDPFAFTTQGREWIKYSWVADILFFLVFRALGLPGLVLFRVGVLLLIALLLYRIIRSCGLPAPASFLLVFVSSLALRFRLLDRPEILSYVLLLAIIGILLRLHAAPPWASLALLPVQGIWANVHASFIFGLGLPALVVLANLLPQPWAVPGWGRLRLDRVRLRHLTTTTACLPLASLLNPHGISMLFFPFRQNIMTRLNAFREWQGIWILPGVHQQWWEVIVILGAVVLAFATTAVLLLAWERCFDPVGWGVLLSMGTYAVLRNRAVPYFVLTLLPPLALALVRLAQHLPVRTPGVPSHRLERAGVLACVFILAVSIVNQVFFAPRLPFRFGVRAATFPEGAAAFLERYHLDGRIFNSYHFGGYLIWRRWPGNQVIIDGRYDAILFDESLLEAFLEAQRSPAALDRITTAYGVDILVLDDHPDRRLTQMDGQPGWARVYWDSVAEVFVRRGERYADLIRAHEYKLTGPAADTNYLMAYRRDPDTWGRALEELRRAVEEAPDNRMAWLGLAQEYGVSRSAALPERLNALNHAANLLAENPIIGRVQADRAEVLLELGRLDEAATVAQGALRLDGEVILARWVLATLAERRGAWGEARDQLQTILARLPSDDPQTALVRGRLETVERHLRQQRGP